jgi:hypothetical protein
MSTVRRRKWAEDEQKRKKLRTFPQIKKQLKTAIKVTNSTFRLFGKKCSQMTGPRVGNWKWNK